MNTITILVTIQSSPLWMTHYTVSLFTRCFKILWKNSKCVCGHHCPSLQTLHSTGGMSFLEKSTNRPRTPEKTNSGQRRKCRRLPFCKTLGKVSKLLSLGSWELKGERIIPGGHHLWAARPWSLTPIVVLVFNVPVDLLLAQGRNG